MRTSHMNKIILQVKMRCRCENKNSRVRWKTVLYVLIFLRRGECHKDKWAFDIFLLKTLSYFSTDLQDVERI